MNENWTVYYQIVAVAFVFQAMTLELSNLYKFFTVGLKLYALNK